MDRSPAIDLTLFEKWGDVRKQINILTQFSAAVHSHLSMKSWRIKMKNCRKMVLFYMFYYAGPGSGWMGNGL